MVDKNELLKSIMLGYEVQNSEIKRPGYLPDKDEISKIIELLRQLLFPGYFDTNEAASGQAECYVLSLIDRIEISLKHQICRALNSQEEEQAGCAGMLGRAEEICHRFLQKIPDVLSTLNTDVEATYNGDPAASNKHEIIFAYPGIFAISVYRSAHELYLLSVPLIPRMMTEYAHSLTGIDIHPGAEIGHHFCIDHGTGIVIGETTVIGAHVKLYQGVTLGALSTRGGQSLRGKRRHPTLEDEVTVYSGASILGGETIIGKGCVIGGNAFITQAVPSGTTVTQRLPELRFEER